jgi:hypothetical protein
MSEPKYDSIWKALPDVVLLALIRLAVPEIGSTIRPWRTNIKALIDREADDAYLMELQQAPLLLHLEYQNYSDPTMALRMFHYDVSLKLQYHQQTQEDVPVLGIVIWAIKGATPPPVYVSQVSADTGFTYRYREIHLNQLDWQQVDPVLLVLAPFLRGVDRANAQTVAVQMYQGAPPEYRNLLLGALFNLMRRSYGDVEEIEQAILQQVRTTMDEIFEAVAQGPMGVKLIERGKAEGLIEGEARVLTVMWKLRFGEVPADVSIALTEADTARLEALLAAFEAQKTEAELRATLGLA